MARKSAGKPAPEFDLGTFLAKLGSGKTTRLYRAKQVVFTQGDPADAVFYVQSGKVKLTVLSTHGKQAVIAILGAGTFFGEGCLTSQLVRISTASTMEASTIVRVPKSSMVALLRREPD